MEKSEKYKLTGRYVMATELEDNREFDSKAQAAEAAAIWKKQAAANCPGYELRTRIKKVKPCD